jgi:hypothetical protein
MSNCGMRACNAHGRGVLRAVRAAGDGHSCGVWRVNETKRRNYAEKCTTGTLIESADIRAPLRRESSRDLAEVIRDAGRRVDVGRRIDLSRHYELGTKLENHAVFVLCYELATLRPGNRRHTQETEAYTHARPPLRSTGMGRAHPPPCTYGS